MLIKNLHIFVFLGHSYGCYNFLKLFNDMQLFKNNFDEMKIK